MKQELMMEADVRIRLNNNDLRAAYAELCNQMAGEKAHKHWIELKQHFEYLLATEAMYGHNWDRNKLGQWHRL